MIFLAPAIATDSWLMEERFDEFRERYGYAASQNRAIPGLSKLTPEEAYHVWAALSCAPVSFQHSRAQVIEDKPVLRKWIAGMRARDEFPDTDLCLMNAIEGLVDDHDGLLEQYTALEEAAREVADAPFGSIDQRAFYRLREVLGD